MNKEYKSRWTMLAFFFLAAVTGLLSCNKTSSQPPSGTAPTVQTSTTSAITENGALSGGSISADGGSAITARGICWSTTANPTIADSKTMNGTGTGTFTSDISGLKKATTYHVRAYATNASGTAYGTNVSFTSATADTGIVGFKVCGSKIFDPEEKEFLVKGVNISGPGFPWPESTTAQFDNVVKKWKFNTIRLALMGAPSLDSYTSFQCSGTNFPQYQYTTFGTVREIVKKYTDAKVVVILEYHKVGSIFTGAELTCASSWWKTMANEYKNNPYVWFDLYNEPQVSSPDLWAASFQTVISEIRSTGNTNIIITTGNWWGQEANSWTCQNVEESNSAILSKTFTDPAENIVYSLHVYDQWNQCVSKLENFLDRVLAQKKCILIGEYGIYNNNDVTAAMQYTLAAVQPRRIGRIAWAWFGGDANDFTTSGNGGGHNTVYENNGVPANTTEFGKAVWDDLRRVEVLDAKKECR